MDSTELCAREAVRDTVARYALAGDSGTLDELAACFAPDGTLEVKGRSRATGRDAIIEMLGRGATSTVPPETNAETKFFQRHFVTNLRFDSIDSDRIEARSYFVVFTPIGADHWGRYKDVFIPVEGEWLLAHRIAAVDASAAGSYLRARWSQ